ncbi:MAG: ribosome-recycling factor, partial [Oscillospiraceae bacterium]
MTKVYEDKMAQAVRHLESEYGSIRAGRATPTVLEKIMVDYYGTPTPINQMAAISITEARTLSIQPWDR